MLCLCVSTLYLNVYKSNSFPLVQVVVVVLYPITVSVSLSSTDLHHHRHPSVRFDLVQMDYLPSCGGSCMKCRVCLFHCLTSS